MDEKKIIETLAMIAKDMEDDAKNFDGQPFTGRTVAALAVIVRSLVESQKDKNHE